MCAHARGRVYVCVNNFSSSPTNAVNKMLACMLHSALEREFLKHKRSQITKFKSKSGLGDVKTLEEFLNRLQYPHLLSKFRGPDIGINTMEQLLEVEDLKEMKNYCSTPQARTIWNAMNATTLSPDDVEVRAEVSATKRFHESVLTRVEIKLEDSKFENFELKVLL